MGVFPDSVVKRDRFYPPRDRQDKVVPHKIETIGFLRAVPHVLGFFDKVVPEEFWTFQEDLGDGPKIVVACPCGEEPVLHFRLRSYSIAECECGRFFMHDSKNVRCGRDEEGSDPPAS